MTRSKKQNAFDKLNPDVAALARARFKEPTDIQKLTIPKVLANKNLLAIAGTGMGKTESLMLPVFSKLVDTEHKPISLLYITPLKALNRDMFDRLLWWCRKLELDAAVRHGDTTQHERKLQKEHPPHLLITTPEQIQGMLTGKVMREHLKNIKYIVIDELHELVDSKRGVQLTLAIERLKRYCGTPQILALSATVGSPQKAADFIGCDTLVKSPQEKQSQIKVEYPTKTAEDDAIAEKIYSTPEIASRLRFIKKLIDSHKSVLLFTNTREAAETLSSRLRVLNTKVEPEHDVHHSSLSKESRLKAETDFKEEKIKAIIATSSLQLGIDIGSVDLVIQYQSPREVSQLTQRIGRSGHGIEKLTKGIIISGDGDDLFESTVIARKAEKKELEPIRFHRQSLDVLSHQLIGLTMEDYSIDLKEAHRIFKNANPFKNLTLQDIKKTAKFLIDSRIAFYDTTFKRRRRAFEYYFDNLSTIPTVKRYRIIDMALSQPIGTLDETFVVEHSEMGSTFIVRGRPWRVISVEKDKVFVELSSNIESAVPAWRGELIPVPFDTAQEVASIRQKVLKEDLTKTYPISKTMNKKMKTLMTSQSKFHVPGPKEIGIETYGEYTILHTCFGSLVNETLSRFISTLVSSEKGKIIPTRVDPYRIIFSGVSVEDVKNIISIYKGTEIEPVLELSLPNTTLFKSRFMQVAKRFGIVRKDSTFDKINVKRLIDTYRGSSVFDETLNEIFVEKLDVEKTLEIFDLIKTKKIKIKEFKGLSPLGELGLKYELHDVARPDRPLEEIMKIFTKRLLETRMRIVCVKCGKYSVALPVKDVDKEPRCPRCGSKLLACVSRFMNEAQSIIKKRLNGKTLTIEEKKKLYQIRRSADMMICYGRKAAITLAGRGVGPETAARVMARMHRTEDELYRDILEAEKKFIETKKYWT